MGYQVVHHPQDECEIITYFDHCPFSLFLSVFSFISLRANSICQDLKYVIT